MWEWRVFYNRFQEPQWVSRIKEMLHNTPVEERTDLYFNLNSAKYGIKIRALSDSHQLLELKVLKITEGFFEYWEKPIKHTIQVIKDGNLYDAMVFSLENFTQQVSSTKEIIDILNTRKCNEIEIDKYRKKTTIDDISIEIVKIRYQNKTQMGVQLECRSSSLLYEFLSKKLAIPIEKYSNVSYPRFLMKI